MRPIALICVVFAGVATPVGAEEPASPWSQSARSAARLIAAGPLEGGVYRAGFDIRLKGDAITYWRQPGEAGVPPAASFEGSDNLADAKLLFPAPKRIAEAGGVEAFGYARGVIFPLIVTPRDPAKPVRLAWSFNYAACEKICVPASASGTLDLLPTAPLSAFAGDLGKAEAQVPRQVDAAIATIAALGGDPPRWRLAFKPESKVADIFAEGAEGWYFDTRADAAPGSFLVTLTDRPKGAALTDIAARFTAVSTFASLEWSVKLDRDAAKP